MIDARLISHSEMSDALRALHREVTVGGDGVGFGVLLALALAVGCRRRAR